MASSKSSKHTRSGSADSDEWRIVLIGKTGAGKSSAGNTILGEEDIFESEFSAVSVTSDCKKARGEAAGRKVAVIDTPGLFDTGMKNEDVWKKIAMCIKMSAPGPHAFLMIVQVGRFTKEEKETVKMIQETFGEDADKYTMVLFTYGDKLRKKTIDQFVLESDELQDIIQKCYGRYHVFNNMTGNPSQVSELIEKINEMIKDNGGSHYTSEMFKKAEEELEREKQEILKQSEPQRNRELEELKLEFSVQMLEMQMEMMKLRHEAEARAQAKQLVHSRKMLEMQKEMMKLRYEAEARAQAERQVQSGKMLEMEMQKEMMKLRHEAEARAQAERQVQSGKMLEMEMQKEMMKLRHEAEARAQAERQVQSGKMLEMEMQKEMMKLGHKAETRARAEEESDCVIS